MLNKKLAQFVFLCMALTLQACGNEDGKIADRAASAPASCPTEDFIRYANDNYCKESAPEKIFFLIDGTDGFPGGSKPWIKRNIFNKTTISWAEEGAEISIARLADRPVADLEYTNICLPKHVSRINNITDNVGAIKRSNNVVGCAVNEIADSYLDAESGASRSVLIETIAEIFKNPRYRFDAIAPGQGVRKFYFVSDLFQNSDVISFYKLCKKPSGAEAMTCPSYDSLVEGSSKLQRYLTEAMPNLNSSDEIYLYNINIGDRIDQSARVFWEQYFVAAGADQANIHYRAELSK